MEEREIIKGDEIARCSINTIIQESQNVYNSQEDKTEGEMAKVENINYGEGYQSKNRIEMSTYGENEDYFNFKENTEKEMKISNSEIMKSQNHETSQLNKSDMSQKMKETSESDLISENNMPLRLIDSSIMKDNKLELKYGFVNTNKDNSLYIIENEFEDKQVNVPHYSVVEKCEVKDYIGFHKLYEIVFVTETEEKKIKCYRRYDNFDKFNSRLRRRYPYMIIPRLTPKNPLVKIITPEEDFYENRRRQLNFYLNFIAKNEFLSKTKEFVKFTNDSEFDEDFFNEPDRVTETNTQSNINSLTNIYFFPESSKISDTLTKKIFSVFSGIFGSKDERKLSDEEIILRKMDTHYKGIAEKYREIKVNVVTYLRTLKNNSDGYKQLSNTCFYLKDTLSSVENANDNFKLFHEICDEVAKVNKRHHEITGVKLENKFESYISILYGLCDAFDRYSEYIRLYENVLKAYREARDNKVDNLPVFSEELKTCENFKNTFDKSLLSEIHSFIEAHNNSFSELIEEFKLLLKSVNSQELNNLIMINQV